MRPRDRLAHIVIDVVTLGSHAVDGGRMRMLALLPHPHQLCIVTTAAAMVHRQFLPRAQSGAVLVAPGKRFGPSGAVQAATDALVGCTAHTESRIKRPAELRAAEV